MEVTMRQTRLLALLLMGLVALYFGTWGVVFRNFATFSELLFVWLPLGLVGMLIGAIAADADLRASKGVGAIVLGVAAFMVWYKWQAAELVYGPYLPKAAFRRFLADALDLSIGAVAALLLCALYEVADFRHGVERTQL